MLPDDTLIELEEIAFLPPRNKPTRVSESWALGGIALSDTSEPFGYEWRGYVQNKAIRVARKNTAPITLLSVTGEVTEVSLAFDQNMRPTIAYVEDDISKLYWYDTSQASMAITEYADTRNPRVALDDKRKFSIANSDIIFAYVKNGSLLCYRLQRERYSIEYTLDVNREEHVGDLILNDIGMGTGNRFVFSVDFEAVEKPMNLTNPQSARLAYPEAAWISRCGDTFPSRVQWLYKYLAKVDVVKDKNIPDLANTSSIVMNNKSTVGSGTTTQGIVIHEQVALDWVKWALGRKVWSTLYSRDKLNTDAGGLELITNDVKQVLSVAVDEGVFVSYEIESVKINKIENSVSVKFNVVLSQTILKSEISGTLYY